MNYQSLSIDSIQPDLIADARLIPPTEDEDASLAADIKAEGMMHPIVVTMGHDPFGTGELKFGIVGGRRRYRAHLANGATHIMCNVLDVEVTTESINGYYRDRAFKENTERSELHPAEIAAEVGRRTTAGDAPKDIASKLNLDPKSVANYQRLTRAPFYLDYIAAAQKREPVPSFRRCLGFLASFKAPKKEDSKAAEEREEAARQAFKLALQSEKEAWEAEVVRAKAEGKEPPKPGAKPKKGKGKKGDGASTSPRAKWKDVQAWWRAAEAALKSGKLPTAQVTEDGKTSIVEGRSLTHDEKERLTSATATLAWVYQTAGSLSRPDVFVLGEEKSAKPKKAKK